MKKILSITLVLAMLLSLPITVFAADGGTASTTTKAPVRTDITLAKPAFRNGNLFYMYDYNTFDSKTGDTVFSCDGEFMTPKPSVKNELYGTENKNPVLQYRHAMKGDYELTYQWKLNKTNTDSMLTFFYWQDYIALSGTTGNLGRDYMTSQRASGFALQTQVANGKVTFAVLGYDEKAAYVKVAAATAAPNADTAILEGAGENAILNVSMKWVNGKLTVSASLAADPTKTTGEAVFNASEKTNVMEAVKEPAGFAFAMNAVAATAAEGCSSVGHIAYKDLTVDTPAVTEVALVKGAFKNGSQFYMYNSLSFNGNGDTVFSSDGEFLTVMAAKQNNLYNRQNLSAVLQSRQVMKGDYELSYQWKLNKTNTASMMTFFYWQDYAVSGGNAGRSYMNSQRGTGFTLETAVKDGKVAFTVYAYDAAAAGSRLAAATAAPNADTAILEGAPENAVLNVLMKWIGGKLTVSVSLASDPTKTTGEAVFDTSAKANVLSAVKDPAGYAFVMNGSEDATACTAIGHISVLDYAADAPAVDPDYSYVALDNKFATLADGEQFVRGNDGWFTRSSDAVAQNNAAIVSKHDTSYNYKLTFKVRLNEQNRGRFAVWNIWDGKFAGAHYGYMFNINVTEAGLLEYRLARYDGGYMSGNYLITKDTEQNAVDVKLLEGQAANAELLVTVTVQDKTLSVNVSLAKDPTKKAGTVTYDFSAGTERTINRVVNRSQGFAIMDMAGQEKLKSAAFGDITYTALPGEKPNETETDDNDYNKILSENNYAWNGNIAASENNFQFYTYNSQTQYENFAIENGWLTRKNENHITDNKDQNVRFYAYAIAQYKGAMDKGDYKLSFHAKADANNQFRFSVMTRWEDKDNNSIAMFKNQIGYRIYFETTEDNKLSIRCYRTEGGWMPALPATAENAASLSLEGIEAGTLEIEVTLVMKGDLIVAEAHLVSDKNKTTGPVAFDMSDDVNMMNQIDRTQGFVLIDSANESKYMPASFGEFKIYAASEPKVEGGSGEIVDPDANITTEAPGKDTAKPGEDSKVPGDDTTANTEKPAEEKKGCKSGISVVPFAAVLVLSAAAVTIGRKRKED